MYEIVYPKLYHWGYSRRGWAGLNFQSVIDASAIMSLLIHDWLHHATQLILVRIDKWQNMYPISKGNLKKKMLSWPSAASSLPYYLTPWSRLGRSNRFRFFPNRCSVEVNATNKIDSVRRFRSHLRWKQIVKSVTCEKYCIIALGAWGKISSGVFTDLAQSNIKW